MSEVSITTENFEIESVEDREINSFLISLENALAEGNLSECSFAIQQLKKAFDKDYFHPLSNTLKYRFINLLLQFLIQSRKFKELEEIVSSITPTTGILEARRLMSRGILFSQHKDYGNALNYLLQAERIAQQISEDLVSAQILINIGTVYAHLHHYEHAAERYELGLKKYQNILPNHTKAGLLHNLGNVHYALGFFEEALKSYEMAQALYSSLDLIKLQDLIKVLKDRVHLRLGTKQIDLFRISEAKDAVTSPGIYIYYLNCACLALGTENFEKAFIFASKAFEDANKSNDFQSQIEALTIQIRCKKEEKNYKEVIALLENLQATKDILSSLRERSKLIEQDVQFKLAQKDVELETMRKHNELSNEILLRNKQLAEANEDLRQFSYVVSHDLKEPLRMIGAYTQLIQYEFKNQIDDDKKLFFEFVSGGVERLNLLLDGLSNYSSIQSRFGEYETIGLDELVHAVLINLDILREENNAKVHIKTKGNIYGSRILLMILFQNLLHNAIKFRTKDTDPKITLTSRLENNNVIIDIKDNGIGIPESQLSRIFIIFQRLNRREEFEGTGMGLAICKKIVQMHDGQIQALSDESGGSTFRLILPHKVKIPSE